MEKTEGEMDGQHVLLELSKLETVIILSYKTRLVTQIKFSGLWVSKGKVS
jgi:hypothetical protein